MEKSLVFWLFPRKTLQKNVLLDCHHPKGPNLHTEDEEETLPWVSYEEAFIIFWKRIENIFGPFIESEAGDENPNFEV